jgi:hypothetical protein
MEKLKRVIIEVLAWITIMLIFVGICKLIKLL